MTGIKFFLKIMVGNLVESINKTCLNFERTGRKALQIAKL